MFVGRGDALCGELLVYYLFYLHCWLCRHGRRKPRFASKLTLARRTCASTSTVHCAILGVSPRANVAIPRQRDRSVQRAWSVSGTHASTTGRQCPIPSFSSAASQFTARITPSNSAAAHHTVAFDLPPATPHVCSVWCAGTDRAGQEFKCHTEFDNRIVRLCLKSCP